MPFTLANTFETALSNDTPITTANSDDGTAGAALTVTDSSSTSTILFRNDANWEGSLGARVTCTSVTGAVTMEIGVTSGTPNATMAFRGYFRIDTMPNANVPQFTFRTASAATVGSLRIGTTGLVAILNNGGTLVSSLTGTALTTGVWYRVEVWITPGTTSTGRLTAAIYPAASMTAQLSGSTTTANFGTTPAGRMSLGRSSGTITFVSSFDAIAATDTIGENFIGPISTPSQPISATIPVVTTVAASVTSQLPASVATPVVTTVSANMALTLPISATTPVVSAVTANASLAAGVAATVPVVTTVSAAMEPAGDDVDWSDTWTDIWGGLPVYPIEATVPVVSTVSAAASKLTPASATVPVVSTVSAAMTKRTSASVTIPVVSTVSAAVGKLQAISATIPVVTTVSAAMENALVTLEISATIPVVSATATSVTLRTGVSATVVVVSSVSADVRQRAAASVTIPVVTTVAGTAVALRPFSASIPIVSSASANPVAIHPVSTVIPVVSTVTAALTPAGGSSATIPVVSTVSAAVQLRAAASATIPVVSAVSVDAKAIHPVSATIPIVSSVSATAGRRLAIAATIPVVSTVSADFDAMLRLAVTVIAIVSTVRAALTAGTAMPAYVGGNEVVEVYYTDEGGTTHPVIRTYLGDEIIWAP